MLKRLFLFLIIFLISITCSYAKISYNSSADISKVKFLDVPSSHWARNTIFKLAAQNNKVFNGYPDRTFKPDANMSRAEFITALVRTMGYDTVTEAEYTPFSDVSNHWANKYIVIAQQEGIIEPNDYGKKLKPDEIISRFEVAKMLINCFDSTKKVANDTSISMTPIYKDAQKLDDKTKKIVHILYLEGVFKGYPDGTSGIGKFATRAELATFIQRFIENSSKLEKYEYKAEDSKPRKAHWESNMKYSSYVTYKELLPEYTRTVIGMPVRNPELKERINSIEWFHIDKNYNGKYKSYIDKLRKVYAKNGNPFKVNLDDANVVALNVTISYSGKIDIAWTFDSNRYLRNASFDDDKYKSIEKIDTRCFSEEELDSVLNTKLNPMNYLYESQRSKTYTLIGIYNHLPTTGIIRIDGGVSLPNATDQRELDILY